LNGNVDIDRIALVIGRLIIGQELAAQQIAALTKEIAELKEKPNGK